MIRRDFLINSAKVSVGTYLGGKVVTWFDRKVTKITNGTKQHWFGYYDKWQISKSGRYALGNEVDTFFRSPQMSDELVVGIIDLKNNNKWRPIGTSQTWGWQQGCMLQWIPGSDTKVIWNDWQDGKYVSKLYDLEKETTKVLPKAIYTLSPDGSYALCLDFDRLQFFRPGYGYPSIQESMDWERSPDDSGIYKMDLHTGESKLIITYAQAAAQERNMGSTTDYYHWFNHLLINPDGTRFIFLNRSRPTTTSAEMHKLIREQPELKSKGFSSPWITRAMTANPDGSDIYVLNDSGHFSHFIWKGNNEICAWSAPDDSDIDAFYDFVDHSKKYSQVGKGIMTHNGHNTYVPNTNYEWILNDTYPLGDDRLQELYLFHVPTSKKVVLGKFHEPVKFKGEWRCDLHPRCDQAGQRVFFDSTHEGDMRQIYMIDIRDIVGNQ